MSQTCEKARFSIFKSLNPDFLVDFQHALFTSVTSLHGQIYNVMFDDKLWKSRWLTGIQTLLSVTPDGCFEKLFKIYGACICMQVHGRHQIGQIFQKIACLK